MSQVQFTLATVGEDQFITVYDPESGNLLSARSDHPNFAAIREAAVSDDPSVVDMFDTGKAVAAEFTRQSLSERVAVSNGHVFFDGDEVHGAVVDQIVRFLDEGVDEWESLVFYMENIAANPSEHSREQLFTWLAAQQITITPEGMILAYKGVHKDGDGSLRSGWTGSAIVDGEPVQGHIPNEVGSVVEMPRSTVVHDPSTACSRGLHVGTFDYARSYARGAMLLVEVNPRDFVSVPHDGMGEKARVCRYRILDVIEQPLDTAVWGATLPDAAEEAVEDEDDLDVALDTLADAEEALDALDYNLDATDADYTAAAAAVANAETEVQRARLHGKGGATSQAAKGRGRNPAQDDAGKFSAGRPGSSRDSGGRFSG